MGTQTTTPTIGKIELPPPSAPEIPVRRVQITEQFIDSFFTALKPEQLLDMFNNRVFVLRYRMKSEIPERIFFADGLEDARAKGRIYCERRKWTFVYVRPLAIDISALPREIEWNQP